MRLPLTTLLYMALGAPLLAQDARPNDSPCGEGAEMAFARVAMSRLCFLARHPDVRRTIGAEDAVSLMAAIHPDALWRMPDAELAAFFATFGESLALIDPAACSTMYPRSTGRPWSETFMSVATAMDSAMAVRWVRALESWVWAKVRNAPRLPTAAPSEVYAYVRRQLRGITARERADIRRMARGEDLPADRACQVVRMTYARLAAGDPAQAGPVLRALIGGVVPWFAAA